MNNNPQYDPSGQYGQQAPYGQQPGYGQPFAAPLQEKAAGVGVRFVALFIDGIVVSIIAGIIGGILGAVMRGSTAGSAIAVIITLIVIVGYYIGLEAKQGATLGKMMLGLRVVQVDGSPITLNAAIVRNLLRIVDHFFAGLVGAILIWNSPLKQRLGDRVANTVVIRTR